MQLTKDEIYELVGMALISGAVNHSVEGLPDRHCFSTGELAAFRDRAIAAHTAKVLGDVEPVGEVILNYSTHMERYHPDGPMNDVAWLVDAAVPKSGTKLYPAHTVAALAARVAGLEKDAADFQMAYRIKCDEETKTQAVEIERLRAALAAKGQA